MIVCGTNIDMDQLAEVKLEEPTRKRGGRWQGIPHIELAQSIEDEINLRGWKVTDRSFALSENKYDLAGAFEVDIPDLAPPEGQRLSIGFITSNNLRRALKLVIGTRVLVCNNGCATGELLLNEKHTKTFDLCNQLESALDTYAERARSIPIMMNALRERSLTQQDADHLLMEAGRTGVMPWRRIRNVDTEYRNPTYADHNERTSFGLLQAFTHVCKQSPALDQMDQMNRFRELLPAAPDVLQDN